jgi:hypothetical protein
MLLYFLTINSILLVTLCENRDNECIPRINEFDSNVKVISLNTFQEIYNQGDEITLKIEIPSSNSYFGEPLNLYDINGDTATLDVTDILFEDNTLRFIKGNRNETNSFLFDVPYNTTTDMYELEVVITLNRIGEYVQYNEGYIGFGGENLCPNYRLTSLIINQDSSLIKFTVTE